MKSLLSLISIGILSATCFGQNPPPGGPVCSQKLIENISSRGIMLGMDIDKVLSVFSEKGLLLTAQAVRKESDGRTEIVGNEYPLQQALINLGNDAKPNFGSSRITLIPKDKVTFEGISRYDLGFLDSKLAWFRVYYLKPRWETQEQFIRTMSTILNVPVDERLMNSRYSLKCGDYLLTLAEISNEEASSSMLVSTDINAEIDRRRKKVATEQRDKDLKTFKP
jgi:hypothetical protein